MEFTDMITNWGQWLDVTTTSCNKKYPSVQRTYQHAYSNHRRWPGRHSKDEWDDHSHQCTRLMQPDGGYSTMESITITPSMSERERRSLDKQRFWKCKLRLEVKHLSCKLDRDTPLLQDVSFSICEKDILILQGKSGCGYAFSLFLVFSNLV